MLSWVALSWVELSSVTLIVLNWNAELSCVELGIWQGLHWLITDDNWGIPLGASAMTVDASEVVQRNLFGDYYWTMWSLFNSTIEQCFCSIVQSLNNLKYIRYIHGWQWYRRGNEGGCSDKLVWWLLLNHVKPVQFNSWTMWSSFNCSIIGQFGVDSVPNICTTFFYIHCTDMNTDADEVEHMTVDVVDEDHQHQWSNGNDERNWFGVRYLQCLISSLALCC